MASNQHVEVEAAKFLHKLIQDSKDEPAKLATKLYVICQHMKMSGKEQSLPYQVISRAMETVISQNKLDIEALKSSRLSLGNIPQIGDSSQGAGIHQKQTGGVTWRSGQTGESKEQTFGRTTQNLMLSKECKETVGMSDPGKAEFLRHDVMNRGSFSQSLEHESSASVPMEDNSSASYTPAGRKEAKKKGSVKRKRADSKESSEIQGDDPQQSDSASTRFNSWKGKQAGRVVAQSHLSAKDGEHSHTESVQQGVQTGQGSETRRQFKGVDERGTNPLPWQNTEKTSTSQPLTSNMPFKEHHLKQLRAQCLVFLAFRNNVSPRKLHLEIALGERYPKEDGNHRGLIDVRGKPSGSQEHGQYSESPGSLVETDSSSKDNDKNNQNKTAVEKRQSSSKQKTEISQLKSESESLASTSRCFSETKPSEDSCNRVNQTGTRANQNFPSSLRKNSILNPEVTTPSINNSVSYSMAMIQHEVASEGGINLQEQTKPFCIGEGTNRPTKPEFPIVEANMAGDRSESISETKSQASKSENLKSGMHSLRELHADKLPTAPEVVVQESRIGVNVNGVNGLNDPRTSGIQKQSISNGLKTIIYCDASRGETLGQMVEKSMDHDDESSSMESLDTPLSPPKFSTSEKWILVQQKRSRVEEEKWASKQRKAEERITTRFEKLKENVNASEDISAKTKSVIELKKLQLLQVQRRLRSDFLGDFFKPISSEMEHLKSIKKHRHGRKIKQLERFEQKMKEERQKRVRERQKEFFGEIEAHKERLEDYLKIKRERCKGINRYIKEFHKRKERIHREKIDRIQREKINLLKANDVEGYLRMVQDAKSDRVKQLLKETEKYLQKLGAKIKEAKSASILFGGEVDCSDAALAEKNEILKDPVDENDQAQHYLESNEKYYLMAHSVKETIEEQPISLLGGKLREYQMNGLRWLVSLYNNHLNGILADEMGLGKTVQVISLICYLMETKNDRGPFLVVVPSSVLPGWDSEINFWAPGINKIMYAGTPEERRRLFKERIVQKKFNVLLTTYEYLMNKHDRPKLSKIDWHYVIIDEGHRIKNASCKLNADLKHYRSNHRLLLTGTPLQNNLEELWALLNFLLPNIFNSAEDFSQWFNKPFQSNNDGSADEALLSEEENLLIINRLHQVLRPFVLRRLKHKVENELPEKIERLVRCEASAYQKLLMKRVDDNLGSIGNSKGRSVHNTVMELRNICNHPYLSQLHADEVDALLPKHYLPPLVRLCGKMEMVDRLLPKLKATGHRVLFFSTMTRLLDVMEEYLHWKHYRYLRLDGHTSGSDRGALIEEFNRPDSSTFIFLLSIRAGGVGVNLQAADTVLIFDTDWNPQVDLQAQARAHRIGQKRDVLVLRLETVNTVEEQVRAAAEHKLGVANQSITAGFFDNNTSAEDRREYLESLLRECKKEEEAPVLDDDALNDLLARSEAEIDVFESVDRQRRELEAATWQKLTHGRNSEGQDPLPIPPRLVTDKDLEPLYKVFDLSETPVVTVKRKGDVSLDTQHYGRGKRAREVRSYEDQWTEEEFEKLCQAESPAEALKMGLFTKDSCLPEEENSGDKVSLSNSPQSTVKENSTPVKRGRGRPRRLANDTSMVSELSHPMMNQADASFPPVSDLEHSQLEREIIKKKLSVTSTDTNVSLSKVPPKVLGRKTQTGETSRGRGKKSSVAGRTKVSKSFSDSPIAKMEESFNTQSSEPKEESAIESTKEISTALSSPALKNDEEKPLSIGSVDLTRSNQQVESENVGNQDTNVLSKMPETKARETHDSTPALVRHISEKKISVTSKKAAAREARNSGGLKSLPLKLMPASTSVSQKDSRGNSIITQIDHKQELDSKTQESSSKFVTIASSRRGSSDSSLADIAPSSEEKDSKSVEKKGSTECGECSYQNVTEPPADQLILEIPPSVQSCGERVIEPSLITVAAGTSDENIPSSDSSTAEERCVASSSNCDSGGSNALTREEAVDLLKDCVPPNLSVSQTSQASLVDHEVSALDNKSTASISFIDFVKDVECTVDVQVHEDVNMPVETVNPMETCDLECKNTTEDRHDKVGEARECPASAMEPAHDLADMPSSCTPMCTTEDSSSVPIITQISSKPVDPEPRFLGSHDNIPDYDALASEDQSVDATSAKDEGNDIDLALQDTIQYYDTSVAEDHSADAACTKYEVNGIIIALRDSIQDYDAAASEGHSADASCAEDEGIDVNVVSEDKHQDYDASLLVGHSRDATFMKDGHTRIGLPSQDKIQDYDASTSAGCAADATCIQDEGNDIGFPSHDKDQDYNVSVSGFHSRDATCMKDEGNETGFPSLYKNQDYDASASEGSGAVAKHVKGEGDDLIHVSQDKNQDDGASPSEGHTADATRIGDDGDDVDLALLDKNQDYGGSVSAGHLADATCAKDEGNEVRHALQDENQDFGASASEDHSADATYIKDEGDDVNLASLDKNQEYIASTAEGHMADATCIKHDGDDVNLASLDRNQDYNASASEGHSADATCIKYYGNDINLVSALEGHAEDATCIMDEGNNFSPVHSLPQNQALDPSQWGKNAEDISHVSSVPSPIFEAALISLQHDKGSEDDSIIDSSSMLIADVDKSSSEQPITGVDKSSSGQPIADMDNSSSEQPQPIADMENSSYKQPITDVDNSSPKSPVAGMVNPSSELSVADVDNSSSWQPTAGVENSPSELPVADMESSSSEPSVADVDKSSSRQPVADIENSSSEKSVAYAENSSSESPVTGVENSSSDLPIADVENSSSELPVAYVGKSSSGQPVADLENSSSEPSIADVDESSSEPPAADVDKSSSEQPVADVDNSSSEQPSADADNSSPEQAIADVEKLSSDQPVVDMDRSSSGQPIADVDNSSSEQPVANVDNSSPAEQDICPENVGYAQMSELSNVGRTTEGISKSGKNSAISETSRIEEDPQPLTEREITGDRVPHNKIDNVSLDEPSQ